MCENVLTRFFQPYLSTVFPFVCFCFCFRTACNRKGINIPLWPPHLCFACLLCLLFSSRKDSVTYLVWFCMQKELGWESRTSVPNFSFQELSRVWRKEIAWGNWVTRWQCCRNGSGVNKEEMNNSAQLTFISISSFYFTTAFSFISFAFIWESKRKIEIFNTLLYSLNAHSNERWSRGEA